MTKKKTPQPDKAESPGDRLRRLIELAGKYAPTLEILVRMIAEDLAGQTPAASATGGDPVMKSLAAEAAGHIRECSVGEGP